jgi:uncharacterized protein (DUF433 family)
MADSIYPMVSDPDILGGIPVFRGTRVPLKNLIDSLGAGHTLDEFLEQFPSVSREAAIAALEHAKELMIEYSKWLDSKVRSSLAASEQGDIVPGEEVLALIEQTGEFKPIRTKDEPISEAIRRDEH